MVATLTSCRQPSQSVEEQPADKLQGTWIKSQKFNMQNGMSSTDKIILTFDPEDNTFKAKHIKEDSKGAQFTIAYNGEYKVNDSLTKLSLHNNISSIKITMSQSFLDSYCPPNITHKEYYEGTFKNVKEELQKSVDFKIKTFDGSTMVLNNDGNDIFFERSN